jgi:D-alanyl-D-alanine carboxypeptidase (penicillin-binding protein 5/6)
MTTATRTTPTTPTTRTTPTSRNPPRARVRSDQDGFSRVLALVLTLALAVAVGVVLNRRLPDPSWPAQGQAALDVMVGGQLRQRSAHGDERAAPIASLAKVMTAYRVLARHPLADGRPGYTITVTARQARDTADRRAAGQSVVPVRVGERLTERQALEALLLPSANNVAAMLATAEAGSVERFVAGMNGQARKLGMTRTRYTDPSGFEAGTVSTAADQLVLARAAMRVPAFAAIVGLRSAVLPVAGRVTNTDRLLGREGFVGIKTGSMTASGGCFMFRSIRVVRGEQVVITGVVLGQPGRDLVTAGQEAARRLAGDQVERLTG